MTATTNQTEEVVGPIDFLLMEFPQDRLTGEASKALADLVEAGIVRILDLMIISKNPDGSVEAMELSDPESDAGGFAYFAGASSGLLGNDDMQQAADAMTPGTVAALLVYENSWAAPFVAAARNSGGEVIASARIPAQDIMDALEALETSKEG
jgi:uncharacterized membrane protein